MSSSDLKKLLTITAFSEVSQISAPLFNNFDITTFIYSKIFNDGTYWTLSNRGDWVEYFYQNQYQNPDTQNQITRSGYYIDLSALSIPELQIKIAREKFQADHWFNIVKTYDSYYEVFGFAAPSEYRHVLNSYINYVDLFEHFILYFKDRAHQLIKVADNNAIYPLATHSTSSSSKQTNIREKFISETQINRYYLDTKHGSQYLTKREYECLSYIAKGKTFKEAGYCLGLTERTVGYYINNIKSRLGCQNKSQLITLFLKNYANDVIQINK